MTAEALNLLCAYSWPGNIRELKNLVERLDIMSAREVIDAADLPAPYNPQSFSGKGVRNEKLFLMDNLKDALKAFEQEFVQRKLLENNNDIAQAAQTIGISVSKLSEKLKRWRQI